MENWPEIPVRKSNGSRHSDWEASENVGWYFRRNAIFPVFLVSFQLIWIVLCGGLFSHHVKFYSFMFMPKISTRVVCGNGKNPRTLSCLDKAFFFLKLLLFFFFYFQAIFTKLFELIKLSRVKDFQPGCSKKYLLIITQLQTLRVG